jgi:hypothetical protein
MNAHQLFVQNPVLLKSVNSKLAEFLSSEGVPAARAMMNASSREEAIFIQLPRIGLLNTIPFLRGRLDKAQLAEACQDEAIRMGRSDGRES